MEDWNRGYLKSCGKAAFLHNYWVCVVAVLILILTGSVGSGGVSFIRSAGTSVYEVMVDANNTNIGLFEDEPYTDCWKTPDELREEARMKEAVRGTMFVALAVGLSLAFVAWLFSFVLKTFLSNPMEVGGCRFFMDNRIQPKRGLSCFGTGFGNGAYKSTVFCMFLRDLYIGLWSLAFVVPGVVKSYEYRMVPYIIAENPGISYRDAFFVSRKMMDGHKMDLFVMDLSFVGWSILGMLTCGIVNLFYVLPYRHAAMAEVYVYLRTEAYCNGVISQ